MNIYIQKLQDICFPNKYTKWYFSILNNAKNKNNSLEEYTEKHHILPKCFKMGGEKDSNNLVILSTREHFIVHMLLPKMIINKCLSKKISSAITKMMNNEGKYYNSRSYETAKKIFNNYNRKNHKFISPKNLCIEVKNLKTFCEKNNLSYTSMVALSAGLKKLYKGYRNINYPDYTKPEKIYSFIDSNGKRFDLTNEQIKKYCVENNLTLGNLRRFATGKLLKYKRFQRIDEELKIFKIKDPDGNLVEIYDLSSFCTNNNVHISSIKGVLSGTKYSHKGYTSWESVFIPKENTGRFKKGYVSCYDTTKNELVKIPEKEFKEQQNNRYIGITKGKVTCFDLDKQEVVKINQTEFDKHKGTRYIGHTAKCINTP